MQSIGSITTTTRHEFNQAFVNVGQNKLVIEQTPMGLDLNTMRGTPVVRVWDAGQGIRVEANTNEVGRWVNTGQGIRSVNDNVYMPEELPDIEFARIAPNLDIESELKRLGVL